MVINVKQNSMKIKMTFPDALLIVSGNCAREISSVQPEFALAICAYSKKVDNGV